MSNEHHTPCLADMLGVFIGDAPALIGTGACDDIMAVAAHLPAGLAWSLFGFEARLGDEPGIDMALSVAPGTPGLALLARPVTDHDFTPPLFDISEWHRLRRFAAQWNTPDSPLLGILDILCLEFDMPAAHPAQAVPSVFFGVEAQGSTVRSTAGLTDTEVLLDCADRFAGKPLPVQFAKTLDGCHKAAQAYRRGDVQGGAFQAGLMLSRPGAGLRICIHNIAPQDTPAYLEAVSWPGDFDMLQDALCGPARHFDRIALALDCMPDGLSPKLGLESYFHDKAQPEREPRWRDLLEELVGMGICLPEKSEALLHFPRTTRLIPISVPTLEGLPGYFTPRVAMRGLHHLKLVLNPKNGLSAKAYVWGGYTR